MIITYYGVSCFKVQAGETVIAFDPPSKESDFKAPRFQANAVFISHDHKDHGGREALSAKEEGKELLVIDGPGEYEFSGIYAKGIKSFHDSGNGEKFGLNTIYKLKFEDIRICHLGDFGEKDLRPETKEAIGEIDILFIPIGGDSVLDAQGAAKVVSQIEPKIAIPMHYKDSKTLKKFMDEFGNGSVKPADKLTLKKKDLSDNKIQVVVLEPCL